MIWDRGTYSTFWCLPEHFSSSCIQTKFLYLLSFVFLYPLHVKRNISNSLNMLLNYIPFMASEYVVSSAVIPLVFWLFFYAAASAFNIHTIYLFCCLRHPYQLWLGCLCGPPQEIARFLVNLCVFSLSHCVHVDNACHPSHHLHDVILFLGILICFLLMW